MQANLSAENGTFTSETARIVAAFVSHHTVPSEELPKLISSTYLALSSLGNTSRDEEPADRKPAVPIRKSVTPDHIICLEDGRKLKMLKRYLRTTYNLTPDEYRVKWGLPADYPMVAPNYAAQRSAFAKQVGLGRTMPSSND